jgi:endonuclease/exonuclease/phosphatase family metal-dependent hydrolase
MVAAPIRRLLIACLPVVVMVGMSSVTEADCSSARGIPGIVNSPSLRVVTLNMAHGRKDGRNQMLLKEETIRNNLLELAQLLDRAEADVIALQEADAASAWSGKFNHVDFLVENSNYDCSFHGVHASNRMYDFGTALLSRYEFQGAFAHSFVPSKPTTTKGFSVAALDWNPEGALAEPVKVKFVSVHLDFSRKSVRKSQVDEMVRVLSGLQGPMVIMGDFNTDWQTEESSLKDLSERLGLAAFDPHASGLSTYGDKGARLDWILVSGALGFSSYAVFPDVVSDHYAVAADLVLKELDNE